MKNLFRLNRSAEKWKHLGVPVTRTDRLRFFLAYAGGDKKIGESMERALRTYSLRFFSTNLDGPLKGFYRGQGSRGKGFEGKSKMILRL